MNDVQSLSPPAPGAAAIPVPDISGCPVYLHRTPLWPTSPRVQIQELIVQKVLAAVMDAEVRTVFPAFPVSYEVRGMHGGAESGGQRYHAKGVRAKGSAQPPSSYTQNIAR
jgi:hypothetical protein